MQFEYEDVPERYRRCQYCAYYMSSGNGYKGYCRYGVFGSTISVIAEGDRHYGRTEEKETTGVVTAAANACPRMSISNEQMGRIVEWVKEEKSKRV